MKPELAHLLLASCACLVGLALSAVLLFRDQRRSGQRATRIDGVATAYRPLRSDSASGGSAASCRSPHWPAGSCSCSATSLTIGTFIRRVRLS